MAKLIGRIPASQVSNASSWVMPEIELDSTEASKLFKLKSELLSKKTVVHRHKASRAAAGKNLKNSTSRNKEGKKGDSGSVSNKGMAGEIEGVLSSDAAGAISREAEGAISSKAEGSLPSEAEGSLPSEAEGSLPGEAEGSLPGEAAGAISSEAAGAISSEAEGAISSEAEGSLPSDAAGAISSEAPNNDSYEEGFRKGEADGFQAGESAGREQGATLAKAELSKSFAEEVLAKQQILDSLLAAFKQPPDQSKELEASLIVLITRVAEVVILSELKANPQLITRLVTSALAALPHGVNNVQVSVNPENLEWLEDVVSGSDLNIEYLADKNLSIGSCRVDSKTSSIDASLSKRIMDSLMHVFSEKNLDALDESGLLKVANEIDQE